MEEEKDAWALETGLPNDFDGYMTNCKFGHKEEYAQAVQEKGGGTALMFLTDLVDKGGELMAQQGWSVGKGWIPSEDGRSMEHPKRENVVKGSMYGDLQTRVIKDLGVKMVERGKPIEAACWDGLGFHWMQEEHATVSSREAGTPPKATGLMPVEYLGELKEVPKAEAAAAPASEVEEKLTKWVNEMTQGDFQLKAIREPEVAGNDALAAKVLDTGPDGFYATHKK